MESDPTLADDSPAHSTTVRVGPYVVAGRVAAFPGVEILVASHEHRGVRVILRRLLPPASLPNQEATLRLQAFQEDARRREALQDPRLLPLFDFARNPDGSAYQAFLLPVGHRSLPRDPRALPVEEWTRIAAEAAAALESLHRSGIGPTPFNSAGVLLLPNAAIRLVPMDFPWPSVGTTPVATTRSLAEWLYGMLAGIRITAGTAPLSLCDLNPRVHPDLDMTVRAAMNPYAVHAAGTPGEFARLLRDLDSSSAVLVKGGTAPPGDASSLNWANVGAWAALLALAGVTLGWLLALYAPRH
jgi:hypothetical protein